MAAIKRKLHRRDYATLQALAAEGRTRKAIAAELRMVYSDFAAELKRNAVALLRLERGEAIHEQRLIERLHKAVDAKGPQGLTPTIFLLKARHRWVDSHKAPPPAPQTNIQVVIPAALSEREYRRRVEARVEPVQIEEGSADA